MPGVGLGGTENSALDANQLPTECATHGSFAHGTQECGQGEPSLGTGNHPYTRGTIPRQGEPSLLDAAITAAIHHRAQPAQRSKHSASVVARSFLG